MQKEEVKDRVILIIGGTSGLGISAARFLVAAGANVVVTGRSQVKVDAAVESLGDQCQGLAGDAADFASVDAAVALAVAKFGRLDGLYHVAGGSGRSQGDGCLHEVTNAGIDYTIDLNLKSLIYSNRAAIQQFLHQGEGGVILNMGSVLGYSPSPDFFASHVYSATKSAVIGFTKSVAAHYTKDNIRANVIAPALVESPMSKRAVQDAAIMDFIARKQPLDGGRIGYPQDLDQAVMFFLSDASRFVTGQVLAIDGGWTVTEGTPRRTEI
ncbi:MAG: NAD(P)-dependent dehydrogenase (short-subunit alcohol dehydrogenase family) [Verrucomicrobiales bacterium]|jgi:NAD(P)-dependent dehydrogenase (short-subunit alcohol dehydrogenase family)